MDNKEGTMGSRKNLSILTILCFITICVIGKAYGGWPATAWADLPKLEYIYDSGDIIWFYSPLEVGGFPPRYVVTYEKTTRNIEFHSISSKEVPKDAPINFQKSKQLPSYLSIEPNEITFKGTKFAIPELTTDEAERLSEWSDYIQRNLQFDPTIKFTLSNALQGSFLEVNGIYYFGMAGGIEEGIGNFGGLIVYRPPDKECFILRSKYLVGCSVTGIIQIGDELALSTLYHSEEMIGTGQYWENDKSHKVGLVLYNIDTGKWRNIPIGDLDVIIHKMSLINDSIWMITNFGISCYQPDIDKMRNWFWSLSLVER